MTAPACGVVSPAPAAGMKVGKTRDQWMNECDRPGYFFRWAKSQSSVA